DVWSGGVEPVAVVVIRLDCDLTTVSTNCGLVASIDRLRNTSAPTTAVGDVAGDTSRTTSVNVLPLLLIPICSALPHAPSLAALTLSALLLPALNIFDAGAGTIVEPFLTDSRTIQAVDPPLRKNWYTA